MIRIEAIRRQFGPRVLFDGLSWTLLPGARVGLVGPNGAGKTTLLRILDGRDSPDAGQVHRPQGLGIGYLPQEVETVEDGSVLSVVLGGFAEVARLELELEQLERLLARAEPNEATTERQTARYGELRDRFEALDGDRIEARARAILTGLGVPERSFHEPLSLLSGGWRMRVVLARLLVGAPGLLLLDEPTNHLDLGAIDWLEGFLDEYEGAVVAVSHDRYFLNRIARRIVELDLGRLTEWHGNYEEFLRQREARRQAAEKAARQQARELARTERFIERFRYKASKAAQVQSRVRALGKVERIEIARSSKTIRFGFPAAPRSGDVVVRAEGVVQRYGTTAVYDGLDLLLERGDRVALVGPNGAGKSTLLKLLAGKLGIDGGRLELGHNVIVRYYAQHQLDELDPALTVLEEMERVAEVGERPRLRHMLGGFLFGGDAVDRPVGVLSGGEKARLALCKMLVRPSNLLLLDEPTNHLDLQSREVLEDALDEYAGTLVVISHDRYFINRVATAIAEIGDGRAELYPGDFDEYRACLARRAPVPSPSPVAAEAGSGERQRRQEERRLAAERRNLAYRARRANEARLAPIEGRIAELERTLAALESDQTRPEVYSDPARAADVGRRKAAAEAELACAYVAWEELAASLEGEAGA
jgi:ATP-binding cassette subfamily F protein 3